MNHDRANRKWDKYKANGRQKNKEAWLGKLDLQRTYEDIRRGKITLSNGETGVIIDPDYQRELRARIHRKRAQLKVRGGAVDEEDDESLIASLRNKI
jgi:hypothetical protein